MTNTPTNTGFIPSDVAFSPSVKAIQSRKGSRENYARMETGAGWRTKITADLVDFLSAQISVFIATVNADGQPYIQHRGGPPGFLRVLDEKTIAFVDYVGNRQYITQGNLQDNPKACLFLIDFAHRRRVKIWGKAGIVEGDRALIRILMPPEYMAKAEQVLLFEVTAWDTNCPQHIPQRFEADDVASTLKQRDDRIAELEAEVARLSAATAPD